MGYHLTIVRTSGKKQLLISREEILELIERDNSVSYEDRGDYLNIKKITDAGRELYFIYQDGVVWVKNPGRELTQALIFIADELGGRVRGDELETYISPDEAIVHPDDKHLVEQAQAIAKSTKKKRNIRQLLINGLVFLVFILLAILVSIIGGE